MGTPALKLTFNPKPPRSKEEAEAHADELRRRMNEIRDEMGPDDSPDSLELLREARGLCRSSPS